VANCKKGRDHHRRGLQNGRHSHRGVEQPVLPAPAAEVGRPHEREAPSPSIAGPAKKPGRIFDEGGENGKSGAGERRDPQGEKRVKKTARPCQNGSSRNRKKKRITASQNPSPEAGEGSVAGRECPQGGRAKDDHHATNFLGGGVFPQIYSPRGEGSSCPGDGV